MTTDEKLDYAIMELISLRKTVQDLTDQVNGNSKDWYTPDEALEKMGFDINPNARRRLQWLRNNDHLTSFGSTCPFSYDAHQVQDVADQLRAGTIIIPTRKKQYAKNY